MYIIQTIKDIYKSYMQCKKYSIPEIFPELLEADDLLCKFISKNLNQDRLLEAERLIVHFEACAEMQGFKEGFECALKLMNSWND